MAQFFLYIITEYTVGLTVWKKKILQSANRGLYTLYIITNQVAQEYVINN